MPYIFTIGFVLSELIVFPCFINTIYIQFVIILHAIVLHKLSFFLLCFLNISTPFYTYSI